MEIEKTLKVPNRPGKWKARRRAGYWNDVEVEVSNRPESPLQARLSGKEVRWHSIAWMIINGWVEWKQ